MFLCRCRRSKLGGMGFLKLISQAFPRPLHQSPLVFFPALSLTLFFARAPLSERLEQAIEPTTHRVYVIKRICTRLPLDQSGMVEPSWYQKHSWRTLRFTETLKLHYHDKMTHPYTMWCNKANIFYILILSVTTFSYCTNIYWPCLMNKEYCHLLTVLRLKTN